MRRKNDAPRMLRTTPQDKNANIMLQIAGSDPIYAGALTSEAARALIGNLERAGIENIYVDDEALQPSRARANPSPIDIYTQADYALGLMGVPTTTIETRRKSTLLPKVCTAGEPRAVNFPISIREIEDISLELAAANLAVCYPSAAKRLPSRVLDEIIRSGNVTEDFIRNLPKADVRSLRTAADIFCKEMLRGNTKLSQSKIPSVMGIGIPSDIEGYNFAPTSGSKGLGFMNAGSLISGEEYTQLTSFKDVIAANLRGIKEGRRLNVKLKDIGPRPKDPSAKATPAARKKALDKQKKWDKKNREQTSKYERKAKSLTAGYTQILRALHPYSRHATCCVRASEDCKVNCLFTSGQRLIKGSIFEGEGLQSDQAPPRMLSGYMHSAFLANPYYFLRLLIHALYITCTEYETEVCAYNAQARLDSSTLPIEDIDEFIKKLPPAVRLNVYSDYVWELIYRDLFDLFSTKLPGRFGTYRPASVYFYDYTKIPGRWSTEQRRRIFDAYNLEWDSAYEYDMPENYHITFSYSGTDASFRHSQIANLAGQNSTFVFSTASLTHARIKEALKLTKQQFNGKASEDVLRALDDLCEIVEAQFVDAFSERGFQVDSRDFKYMGQQYISQHWSKEFILPEMYAPGIDNAPIKVVSGDLYDIRYFDEYLKSDPNEALIVGLGWKTPDQIKVKINNKTVDVEPAVCSLVLESDPNVEDVSKGVGFGIARYNLGRMFELTKDDVKQLFTVFVTAKRPDQRAVNELISDLVTYGEDTINGITFNTETGLPINTMLGSHNLEFVLVNQIVTDVEDTFGED